jgi:hypothetical protein
MWKLSSDIGRFLRRISGLNFSNIFASEFTLNFYIKIRQQQELVLKIMNMCAVNFHLSVSLEVLIATEFWHSF